MNQLTVLNNNENYYLLIFLLLYWVGPNEARATTDAPSPA